MIVFGAPLAPVDVGASLTPSLRMVSPRSCSAGLPRRLRDVAAFLAVRVRAGLFVVRGRRAMGFPQCLSSALFRAMSGNDDPPHVRCLMCLAGPGGYCFRFRR